MTTFGQPSRSATQDANAGVVNPPSVKHTARKVATKQVHVEESGGLDAFAQSMGNALTQRLTEEAQNINEQRATDAAIRQGQDHAINTVDANKKRTGWEKAIFGENIEYRVAQQRAAQNAVQSAYLEQATTLDQYAGETPDEYKQRLKSGLDKVLEPYGDDAETKRIVTSAYQTMSAKLAAKHYESHYAYNQQQQRETYYNQTLQTFDQWQVDRGLISSPEEMAGFTAGISSFFERSTKPEGMTDIAWEGVVNEALSTSLRNGNIGAYNAAKAHGWLDNQSAQDRIKLEQAVSAYDTDFSQKAQLTVENTHIAALEVATLDEAAALYQRAVGELDNLTNRSSGTERADLAIAKAKKALMKGYRTAFDTAKDNEKKATDINKLKEALRIEDPIERAGAIGELDPKKSELEDVMDLTIVEDVTRLSNSEVPLTESEAVKVMMENPEIAKSVSVRMRGKQVESPLIKRVIETFLNGYQAMTNENGQLNERGVLAMQSVSQFAQNEDTFKSTIGAANYDKYEIVRRGMAVGLTIDMVNKEVDAYTRNKGNRDQYSIDWNLKKDESKRDRVTSLYKRYTGSNPNGAALAYAQEELDRGLIVHQGDMRQAENYLKVSLQNASISYRGRTMINAKHLNDVTSYNFEQLMDGANKQVGRSSLLTPFLMAGGVRVDDDNPYAKLEDSMSFFTVDGTDGFFVDSPQFQQPIRVSSDVMKAWAAELDQRANFKALEQKASDEHFDKWLKEQETLRKYAPLGAGFY